MTESIGDLVAVLLGLAVVGLLPGRLLGGERGHPRAPRKAKGGGTEALYVLPIIGPIAAAGLAGCAGQSEYDVHFFKGHGFGAQGGIIAVTQSAPVSSSSRARPANRPGTASPHPVEGDGGGNEVAAGESFSDREQ